MGFREPLDTSAYQAAVGLLSAPPREEKLPDNPVVRGFNTPEFTTENRVAVRCQIWDVNGWYTALGFQYPFQGITIAQLRLAYLERGGPDSERLTWIIKALRNRHVRAFYDSLEFGEFYQGDPVFQRWLAVKAAQHASFLRARGDRSADFESVLADWGFDLEDEEDPIDETRDDQGTVSDSSETPGFYDWGWGYYLWRSRSRDLARLARWQDLLVTEFARAGVRRRICVGYMGHQPHRATVCRLSRSNRVVMLLHEDVQPTQDLAAQVVASYTGEAQQ
jgi:hypothetical protein